MPKKKPARKPVKAKADHVGSDWLLLTEITADPDVQGRVELDEEVVADYSRVMLEQVDTEEGVQFPPAVVFDDGTTKWLSDGFHRYTAAQQTGGKVDRLDCEIRQGTKRDAMLFALGSNTDHGLRPSAADKRKAVSRMLQDEEWGQWADRERSVEDAASPIPTSAKSALSFRRRRPVPPPRTRSSAAPTSTSTARRPPCAPEGGARARRKRPATMMATRGSRELTRSMSALAFSCECP
jgi:hypothetical protein